MKFPDRAMGANGGARPRSVYETSERLWETIYKKVGPS